MAVAHSSALIVFTQVHEAKRKQSVLSDELGLFNWRVDVQSSGKHQKVINEPTAVLEFVVADKV